MGLLLQNGDAVPKSEGQILNPKAGQCLETLFTATASATLAGSLSTLGVNLPPEEIGQSQRDKKRAKLCY
jgi:hypothetical protein